MNGRSTVFSTAATPIKTASIPASNPLVKKNSFLVKTHSQINYFIHILANIALQLFVSNFEGEMHI